MIRLFVLICLVFININAFSENIVGTWYRNSLFATAELVINQDMSFSIEAIRTAHSGSISGTLSKIRDGYYFSYINDQHDLGQSCIIIFVERAGNIEITVYGDQVGAGFSVFYDGIYERNQLSDNEFIEKALDYIIGDYFNKNIVRELLGNDIEYFTHCFGVVFVESVDNAIIINGWMPGAAPWQNGIIKIKDNNIYILITDCRGETNIFNYYTNDNNQVEIPDGFRSWHYFNEKIYIISRIVNIE